MDPSRSTHLAYNGSCAKEPDTINPFAVLDTSRYHCVWARSIQFAFLTHRESKVMGCNLPTAAVYIVHTESAISQLYKQLLTHVDCNL